MMKIIKQIPKNSEGNNPIQEPFRIIKIPDIINAKLASARIMYFNLLGRKVAGNVCIVVIKSQK